MVRIEPYSRAAEGRLPQASFPRGRTAEWNDWRWQLRNRVKQARPARAHVRAVATTSATRSSADRLAAARHHAVLREPDRPRRRRRAAAPHRVIPSARVRRTPARPTIRSARTAIRAVPGLVHRYPDRVLLLVHRLLLGLLPLLHPLAHRRRAGRRLSARPAAVGGGDRLHRRAPGDPRRADLGRRSAALVGRPARMAARRACARSSTSSSCGIGTKVPAVLPQRVTPALVEMLKKHHPFWMSLHFTHPDELTPEVGRGLRPSRRRRHPARQPDRAAQGRERRRRDDEEAVPRAAEDAGAAVLPLSVRPDLGLVALPHAASTRAWRSSRGCAATRPATPCRPTSSTRLAAAARSRCIPDYVVGRDGDDLMLRNFEGKMYRYPDPDGTVGADRAARGRGNLADRSHLRSEGRLSGARLLRARGCRVRIGRDDRPDRRCASRRWATK